MSKELTQIDESSNGKSLEKGYTAEAFKNLVKRSILIGMDTADNHNKFNDLTKKKIASGSDKEREDIQKELDEIGVETAKALTLDTKYHLVGSVTSNQVSYALEMCRELESEFGIKAASEKALVQMAVISYMRYLECSKQFKHIGSVEYLTHEKAYFYSIYSKDIDRSYRQYTTALAMLNQARQKVVSVKINAQTAFIAENQQNIGSVTKEINEQQ